MSRFASKRNTNTFISGSSEALSEPDVNIFFEQYLVSPSAWASTFNNLLVRLVSNETILIHNSKTLFLSLQDDFHSGLLLSSFSSNSLLGKDPQVVECLLGTFIRGST